MNFVQTLRKRSELQPGVPALVDRSFSRDRLLTYAGLNRLVDFISIQLEESGVSPGDCILFGLRPGQEMYGYLLAALEIGAIPILYEVSAPHDEFIAWIGALEPKLALVPKRGWIGAHYDSALKEIPKKLVVRRVRSQRRLLRLGKLGTLQDASPDTVALYHLVPEESGHLTLRAWSQTQLLGSVQFLITELKLKAGEIDLCPSPLQLIANLAAGLTSVIATRSHRGVEKQVEKFKPTRVAANSRLIRLLLRKSSSPLHRVYITNAPLAEGEVSYFRTHSQRASIELAFSDDLPLAGIPLKEYEQKGEEALVGTFFHGVEAKIRSNPVGDTLPDKPAPGETRPVGELLVRADFLPARLSLADFSASTQSDLARRSETWRPTGAFGYFDSQNRFWLVERSPR